MPRPPCLAECGTIGEPLSAAFKKRWSTDVRTDSLESLKELTEASLLLSPSPKTPVRVAFPLEWRERLFPNLFVEAEPTV